MAVVENGPWIEGLNSLIDPTLIGQGQYQFAFNTINRGGRIQTRPAFRSFPVYRTITYTGTSNTAGGLTLFHPKGGVPCLVASQAGKIAYSQYPFTGNWTLLPNLQFRKDAMIHFELAVKAAETDDEGNVTRIDPYPILMISDGHTRTGYWDGVNHGHSADVPIGSWMKWIGNRLWIFNGRKGYASDLLDPLGWNEQEEVNGGGFFVLPDDCTGLGVTTNYKNLLAFTDTTTSSFQADILDRDTWASTQEFQRVILPSIGCAAGRTIINQYGMTWWLTHSGVIALDEALQTYRTSKIHFRDQNMARSKMNLSRDISRACAGSFENFLFFSVPSGDSENYHTWVMDQGVVDTIDQISPPAWASVWTGIRPVQWVTGIVNGELRCFAQSYDIAPEGDSVDEHAMIWEAFIDETKDIGYNAALAPTAKDIPAMFETRFMGDSDQYKLFGYAEIELDEASGIINIQAHYAGRRSGYKEILNKQIVATRSSLQSGTTEIVIDEDLEAYLPQKRVVKTESDSFQSDDPSPEVEKEWTRNKDRSFSIMVRWTGRMSVSKIRIHFTEQGAEMVGRCEETEDTDRYIRPNGEGEVLETGPVAQMIDATNRSRYLSTVTPRWSESIHSSTT